MATATTSLPNSSTTTAVADAGTPTDVAKETTLTTNPLSKGEGELKGDAATTTTPATTTPTTTTTTATTEKGITDLIDQAKKAGFNETQLQEGITAFNSGYMDRAEFQTWMDRVLNPTDAVEAAEDQTVGDDTTTETPTTTTTPTAEETAVTEAESAYEKTMSELSDTYKESQEAITASAEALYNTQVANLDAALALQQQLAAQQSALIASSTDIQKQEVQNAYDANMAAIELQKKKVSEAYDAMKIEQELLNTQRVVREETAMGLIYGGFGSVAANKNLEETILTGERELMQLSQDAVNADTELQNSVVELNKAYELDLRKIEQWKTEQNQEVYASLASYIAEITADKNMAAVEKDAAIVDAVADYNTKIAEISATTAQTRLDLALELMTRADGLKQQEFNNQIAAAEETRAAESYEYEQNRTVINDARTDLELVLTDYAGQDYSTLPADVLAQIKALEESAGLPAGTSSQILEKIKADELKQGDITSEYTNSVTGEVTAIKYNFETGKITIMPLGELDTPDSPAKLWTEIGVDEDGNIITMNEATGEIRTQGQYSGASGTPEDALATPDGSYGGQCGHFVNQYTGLTMGDTYASKMELMDPSLTGTIPEPGMVFVMKSGSTGHTGFVVSVDESGGIVTVKDSNYYSTSDPEAVRTHTIPLSQITGLLDVSGASSTTQEAKTTEETTPEEEVTRETLY